ncbi:hypothetical protein AVEN_71631-1 [Araneus ventricosus]|uniref:Uncharacterized protein n=1 Tax=Araneus ventricosus TaxID=182803 RepID=A0A4Y2GFK9_ARAVE|nr:hypothetical protein AVEN_71631-1 [Araneus ventricosus]
MHSTPPRAYFITSIHSAPQFRSVDRASTQHVIIGDLTPSDHNPLFHTTKRYLGGRQHLLPSNDTPTTLELSITIAVTRRLDNSSRHIRCSDEDEYLPPLLLGLRRDAQRRDDSRGHPSSWGRGVSRRLEAWKATN